MSARNGNGRRVTMQDVARRAGVSQSTVSFVINDVEAGRIAAATRARVLRAADDLGYRPRAAGRHRAGQRHPWIGMLVDEIATSQWAALSAEGAQEAAWGLGRTFVVAMTGGRPEIEDALIASWRAQGIEGVIYASILTRRIAPPTHLADLPTVLLNCHCDDPAFPSVVPAETIGGLNATRALIDAGHTRIGMINGEPWMEAARDRHKGYRQALSSHDLAYDPDLVVDANFLPSGGYQGSRRLMALETTPTALFCASDQMAIGAYEALKEMGKTIPGDIAVMGYDDQEVAQHLNPKLSSVVLPHAEMGRWAADYLITTRAHGQGAPVQIKLDCPLVMRESV